MQEIINSGTIFSKLKIIQSISKKHKSKKIFVCYIENNKKYEEIASFLQIKYKPLEQLTLEDLDPNTSGIFMGDFSYLQSGIDINGNIIKIQKGDIYTYESLIEKLTALGYEYSENQVPNTFIRNGDTITVRHASGEYDILINFWGDEIEQIIINTYSSNQNKAVTNIQISSLDSIYKPNKYTLNDTIKNNEYILILLHAQFEDDYEKIIKGHKNIYSFVTISENSHTKNYYTYPFKANTYPELIESIKEFQGEVIIYTKNDRYYNRISQNISKKELLHIDTTHRFLESYITKDKLVICEDVLKDVFIRKINRKKLSDDIDLLSKIHAGDHIVHIDHGVGIFNGIVTKTLGNIHKEYIDLTYAKNEKLYVPIDEVGRITKYIGVHKPKITSLSGNIWERKITKVKKDVQDIAEKLIESYAQRKLQKSDSFVIFEEEVIKFKKSAGFIYTDSQEKALEEIFADVQNPYPMDRLIVGDVGYGKTEIAFQAILQAYLNKKQSVFIAPLVVLAHEHYNKAIERFLEYNIRIEILSRFTTSAQFTAIKKKLKSGEIDCIIGTHKALSAELEYNDLGLIVIDEEHKFGVKQKEKIKNIALKIHILSLSATPIPRSLNMALSGVKDLSILQTPPKGRKDIKTYLSPYSEEVIYDAIKEEFDRGGQVFFVHNRVSNIHIYKETISKLFPDKNIVVAHGQLPGEELENRIIDFKNKKYDVLIATTVIENGIDFENVNTIFINECQSFGISQLHQLRGRVGRSNRQGYCYLLYRKENMQEETAKRIKALLDHSYLGAGFELSIKDLEIRGGGDILGIEQSGHSSEIGVTLFLKLIEEKISKLQNNSIETIENKKVIFPIQYDLSNKYFNSETDKFHFYREIEKISQLDEYNNIYDNFSQSQYFDADADNFFKLLKLKIYMIEYKIEKIEYARNYLSIEMEEFADIAVMRNLLLLDKKTLFSLVHAKKIRTETKNFGNPQKGLQYLLEIFEKKIKPKIKLKN